MGLTSNKLYSGSPDIWSDRTYYRKSPSTQEVKSVKELSPNRWYAF